MTKTILAFLLFSTIHSSYADTSDNVLAQIDKYLGAQSLQLNFVTGDEIRTRLSENAGGLKDELEKLNDIVYSGDKAQITVKSVVDGHVFETYDITRAKWDGWKGNYARAYVEFMNGYGFAVTMDIVDYTEIHLLVNKRPAKVMAVKIAYEGVNKIGTKIVGEMYVSNQLPGIAQVPYRHEKELGIERYWSVLSFSRATTSPNL